MSTRRARIKAVTSLPPRRKNTESTDSKNKNSEVKEPAEQNLKSPRTPRPLAEKNFDKEDRDLQVIPSTDIPADGLKEKPHISVIKTPNRNDKVITGVGSPSNTREKNKTTPKQTYKTPIPTSVIKPNINVFLSPQLRKDSPFRKTFTSPLAPSPSKAPCNGRDTNQTKNFILNKHTSNIETINENNELQITDTNVNKITHNVVSPVINKRSKETHTQQNITEETVMDGIVPLKHANNVPKPIDLLKNEIISENVEVLFDPIVPLPSPSKVRPKLRPAPKLGPHRRSSIQGSASESEDESRRAQISSNAATPSGGRQRHDSQTSTSTHPSLMNRDVSRIRNDSISSSISTVPPVFTASPLKEKQKSRRHEISSRRMAAMRLKRENVKRDGLTMYDLIFYNPTSNPITLDKDEIQAKEENAKEAEKANKQELYKDDGVSDKPKADVDDHQAEAVPVPQIKLGPNGEIILDEQSLVIKQTDACRKVSSVVREGAWGGGGGKYMRAQRTAEWSAAETVRFYRALAAIGTDFTLMAQLFPDRSRKDLKLKFKKEEKHNCGQVDKALRYATTWDALQLQSEFDAERAEAKRKAQQERERLASQKLAEQKRILKARERRTRISRASKAVESTMMPGVTKITQDAVNTADDIMKLALDASNNSGSEPLPLHSHTAVPLPQLAAMKLLNKNRNTANTSAPTNVVQNTIPNTNNSNIPGMSNSNTTAISSPSNIETGSLVVLTVNDPMSPSKKMLQTYIAQGGGRLTPVALPTTLLNSVVGYMKKGTPKGAVSAGSSPHFTSPNSGTSQESRAGCASQSVIQVNPSPVKRQRHSSFTITQI